MAAGEKVMELIASNIRPRDIVTRKSLENAAAVVAASGGSTNAGLHLPAIANEAGIKFDLFDVAEIFRRTPYLASLKPGGKYVAKDMYEAGGVPMLMKTLLDHGFLHGDCLTVTGRTIADNLKNVRWNADQDVMVTADKPLSHTGGVVGLKGNLAPEGAIVRSPASRSISSPVLHAASTPKRSASRRSRTGNTRKATSSSFDTRVRAAVPGCAKCCRPPPRSTDRAPANPSRSSPMGASPAARAVSASDISVPKQRSVGRSR
jgi:hypothetical protein